MRDTQNETPADPKAVPPFWIAPKDALGRSLDERVCSESERLWRWAYRYVDHELGDAPSAAELLEEVAVQVSARLEAHPEVARNLYGYMITSFHHRVMAELLKNNRLVYEGLIQELEENHRLAAPNWIANLEVKLCVRYLISILPHPASHMLHYRMLEFSWGEIGKRMGMTAKNAKALFYRELQKAADKLLKFPARDRWDEDPDDEE